MNRDLTIHNFIPQQSIYFHAVRAAALMLVMVFVAAIARGEEHRRHSEPTIVVIWDSAALQAVRDTRVGPPMVSRALAVVHTCIYDAWAAYDTRALGTRFGGALRRPPRERTRWRKQKAISFAAFRALADLFSSETSTVFDPLMRALGYDPADFSTDPATPSGIGNLACAAVLAFRHHDGSNQLGDLHPGAYSDWTGYGSVNPPSTVPVIPGLVNDPNHWQPLTYFDGTSVVTQKFVGAQWGHVIPFAMTSPDQFRAKIGQFGPAQHGTAMFVSQAQDLVRISANLTDKQKMIAEYWANGPGTELPPGHWALFGQFVSQRDHHTIGQDAKMFFALCNAMFDAGIAAWDAKRAFDSVRPVTAIPFLLAGQKISAWGGTFQGTQEIDGAQWIPYQQSRFPTPPFPEYVSGHSAFSAAGAEILSRLTGSDFFGNSVTLDAGSSSIEPGMTPANSVTLSWTTFREAANEAGMSRRYGGIHFELGDLAGRLTGRLAAARAWRRAQFYFNWRDHADRK